MSFGRGGAHSRDNADRYSTVEAEEVRNTGKTPSVLADLVEGPYKLIRRYAPEKDSALPLALGPGFLQYKLMNHAELTKAVESLTEPIPSRAAIARAAEAFPCAPLAETVLVRPCDIGQQAPLTSIIIPAFNKVEFTKKCVQSLLTSSTKHPAEIIVIDNASSDSTASFLAGLGKSIQVITNLKNLGYGGACNQGAARSRSRYLAFLNNDTIPEPGWLDALVEMLERDSTIGAAGSRLIYPDGRLQEAGGLIFRDASGWNFGRFEEPSLPAFADPCEVDYCSGAALLVRRESFEKLGGFDRRYAPAYYEDTDLCFAVRALGYKVMYCPTSTVIHYESATAGTDQGSGFKRYQIINRWKFAAKWVSALARQDPPPIHTSQHPTTADRRRLALAPSRKRRASTIIMLHYYYAARALLEELSQRYNGHQLV